MTEDRSLIQVVDHTTFDFLVPKRNAKAHASLPVPLTRVPFHHLMEFINKMILPPITAGFNIEVGGVSSCCAFITPNRLRPAASEFSSAPRPGALMMRRHPHQQQKR
jgi:hypothetical protein